ncbi:MAG: hypothetical protein ACFE9I_15290 [Candidatus Hermodarchaeota archaeon]
MRRNIILNLAFLALFIIFLILSIMIDFFFFIPIICFLPFTFRTKKFNKNNLHDLTTENSKFKNLGIRYCSHCGGKITEPIAKFCYHCGEHLNNV